MIGSLGPSHESAGALTSPSIVVAIVMENQNYDSVFGCGSACSFITSLANNYGLATNYHAIQNPSLPNYMALFAGQPFSWTSSDCEPNVSGCNAGNAENIVDRIEAARKTWKGYAEDYPVASGCYLAGPQQQYVGRHFPFNYFQDITNNPSRCGRLVRANTLPWNGTAETDDVLIRDLQSTSTASNFMWLTPNLCDDMHDCSVSFGNGYLASLIPQILASPLFLTQNAALVLTWDEGYSNNYQVATILAGTTIKASYKSNVQYSHYSLLATLENIWSMPSLTSNDASATPMTEFFGSSPLPLTASFNYTPSQVSTGTSVSFTGSATGGTSPYRFSWSFGDGASSRLNPAIHSYPFNGTYTVTFTVTDSGSAVRTVTYNASLTVGSTDIDASSGSSINYDPSFDTVELTPNQNVQEYEFWHPNTHGPSTSNAYISDSTLHTLQDDTFSTSWANFDNAVAHQGHFPWETDCGVAQKYDIDWMCPRNSYGLQTLASADWDIDLSSSLSFLTRTQSPNTGEYDLFIGLYFYFNDGTLSSPGSKGCEISGSPGPYRWLEAQVRFNTNYKSIGKPVGYVSCWDPGFDFGYSETVLNLLPGQSYTLTRFDVYSFYQRAMVYWGLSPSTHAIMVGIEVGTEGYGVKLGVDWHDVSLITKQPAVANADFNFNQVIDAADLSLALSLLGQCPPVYYTTNPLYQWRVNVEPANPCIDSSDVAAVSLSLGTIVGSSSGLQGDINKDCKVDMNDVSIVTQAWDSTSGSPTWNPAADLNDDGEVRLADVALVAFNFGKTC